MRDQIRFTSSIYLASHIILCAARVERIWPPQSVRPIPKNPVSAAVAARPEHKANVFSKMFSQFRFVGQIATYAVAPAGRIPPPPSLILSRPFGVVFVCVFGEIFAFRWLGSQGGPARRFGRFQGAWRLAGPLRGTRHSGEKKKKKN